MSICTLAVLLSQIMPAAAQTSDDPVPKLGLTTLPPIIEVEVENGTATTATFTLRNDSEVPLPVQLELMGYGLSKDGSVGALVGEGVGHLSWVSMSPQEVLIGPGESTVIEVQIAIPSGTPPGSYFLTVVCKPFPPDSYFQPNAARFLGYVGEVVVMNVDPQLASSVESSIVLKELEAPSISTQTSVPVSTTLGNSSSFYHRVGGVLTARDVFGNVLAEQRVEELTLLPGQEINLAEDLNPGLALGPLSLALDLKSNTVGWSRSATTWSLPIGVIIVGIIFLLLVIVATYVIWRRRRNLWPAIKALLVKDTRSVTKTFVKTLKSTSRLVKAARRRPHK